MSHRGCAACTCRARILLTLDTAFVWVSFTLDENVSTQSKVKSSVMRGIVRSIEKEYPCFNNELDQMLPKKEMAVAKWCARNSALRP